MTSESHPTPQYSITVRMEYPHEPGWMAKIAAAVAMEGGAIGAADIVHVHRGRSLRDYTIECPSPERAKRIVDSLRCIAGLEIKSVSDDTFLMHLGGKLEICPKVRMKTRADLSMAYTPGVRVFAGRLSRIPSIRSISQSEKTVLRSFPTVVRCWVSVTSVQRRRCR